jgi:Zn-dependent protease/predicted transcriptional regulator
MFNRAFKLMTLSGFDIKVDPSWLFIAALITWSLSAQYFPTAFPDQTPTTYMVMAVAAMLGFFASLLLHEIAHSLVARRFGVGIKSITLFLFGGVAEMQDEPPSASAEMLIALAGPVMSLALALVFTVASTVATDLALGDPVARVLGYLGTINLILAVFNLLPAFPLDGGRVLRAILWKRGGDMLIATETAAKSGSALAYVLIGIGLFAIFNGFFVGGLWQILLGSFLLLAARTSYQQQLQKTVFSGLTVADAMTPDPVTVSPDMTLSHVINQVVLRHRVSFLPVVENGVLLGKIDGEVLGRIDRENWNSTKVGDVFVEMNGDKLLTPDTDILDVLELIGTTGQRKFLVTDGRQLAGVITLADLTRYMSIVRTFDQGGNLP